MMNEKSYEKAMSAGQPQQCQDTLGRAFAGCEQPPITPSIRAFLMDRADGYRSKAHRLETMARSLPHMSQEFAQAFWDNLLNEIRP